MQRWNYRYGQNWKKQRRMVRYPETRKSRTLASRGRGRNDVTRAQWGLELRSRCHLAGPVVTEGGMHPQPEQRSRVEREEIRNSPNLFLLLPLPICCERCLLAGQDLKSPGKGALVMLSREFGFSVGLDWGVGGREECRIIREGDLFR